MSDEPKTGFESKSREQIEKEFRDLYTDGYEHEYDFEDDGDEYLTPRQEKHPWRDRWNRIVQWLRCYWPNLTALAFLVFICVGAARLISIMSEVTPDISSPAVSLRAPVVRPVIAPPVSASAEQLPIRGPFEVGVDGLIHDHGDYDEERKWLATFDPRAHTVTGVAVLSSDKKPLIQIIFDKLGMPVDVVKISFEGEVRQYETYLIGMSINNKNKVVDMFGEMGSIITEGVIATIVVTLGYMIGYFAGNPSGMHLYEGEYQFYEIMWKVTRYSGAITIMLFVVALCLTMKYQWANPFVDVLMIFVSAFAIDFQIKERVRVFIFAFMIYVLVCLFATPVEHPLEEIAGYYGPLGLHAAGMLVLTIIFVVLFLTERWLAGGWRTILPYGRNPLVQDVRIVADATKRDDELRRSRQGGVDGVSLDQLEALLRSSGGTIVILTGEDGD